MKTKPSKLYDFSSSFGEFVIEAKSLKEARIKMEELCSHLDVEMGRHHEQVRTLLFKYCAPVSLENN